jgi:hypothetical protein
VAPGVIGGTEAMPRRDDGFAARRMHAAFRAPHQRIGQLRRTARRGRTVRSTRGASAPASLRASGGLSASQLLEQPLARKEHKYQQQKLAHDLANSRGNKSPVIQITASNDRAMQQHFEHEAATHVSEQQRDERSQHPA